MCSVGTSSRPPPRACPVIAPDPILPKPFVTYRALLLPVDLLFDDVVPAAHLALQLHRLGRDALQIGHLLLQALVRSSQLPQLCLVVGCGRNRRVGGV